MPDFLSNLANDRRELIERAIAETGFDVFIVDEAVTLQGRLLHGSFAVWTNERGEHGPFWNAYRRIEADAEAEKKS